MKNAPLFLIPFLFFFGQSKADNTTPMGQAEQPSMTAEQRSTLEAGLRNPYVLHLRKALNGYLDGTNVGIDKPNLVIKFKCGGVPSGLDCFSKDYFRSKFVVFSFNDHITFRGKVITIIFQDKPDRLFVAWVRRFGDGSYDLSGFWQNKTFGKEVMKKIRKAYNFSQFPAL